jgi:signal transduction histidine kinase
MTIKNRIAIFFTAFTAVFIGVICIFTYLFSRDYTLREFNNRLMRRAEISAMTRLEADEMSQKIYQELKTRYFQKLPFEQEFFIEVDLAKRSLLDRLPPLPFPNGFVADIFEDELLFFREGNTQYCAIIYRDNEGDYIVVASAIDQYGQTKLANLARTLLISVFAAMTLIFLTARSYANRAIKPLLFFVEEIKKVEPGNLKYRISGPKERDEVALLTKTFNQMMTRLETSFEIQQNFIGNASHELKNPLAAILGVTEIALNKDRSLPEYQKALSDIQKEALRLEDITNQLLQLARVTSQGPKNAGGQVHVEALMARIIQDLQKLKPEANYQLSGLPNGQLAIQGNESLLYIAIYNVLENASKFSNNQMVAVELQNHSKNLIVEIADLGIGIPEKELHLIFEPFYRSANTRTYKGYGIGLPLSKSIIELHGGSIQALSGQSKGARFKIILPKEQKND